MKPLEVVKLCAQKYAEIDETLKKKYTLLYQKDQEDFVKRRADYETKLTDEQKREIAAAKEAQVEKKERVEYKKVS